MSKDEPPPPKLEPEFPYTVIAFDPAHFEAREVDAAPEEDR